MASNIAASVVRLSDAQWSAKKVLSWSAGAAYIGALVIVMIYVAINAPAMREATERYKAEQIDQDNTAFCQRFGMAGGTDAFAACASALGEVRKRHEERITRDLVGFL
jgi:hypothetical protein